MAQVFRFISLPAAAAAKLLQSCPTLCDPIDGSPPGSLVQGILQARILEWVAISFSWLACLVPGRLNEENNSKNKIIPGNFQVKFHNSKYKKIKKKKLTDFIVYRQNNIQNDT